MITILLHIVEKLLDFIAWLDPRHNYVVRSMTIDKEMEELRNQVSKLRCKLPAEKPKTGLILEQLSQLKSKKTTGSGMFYYAIDVHMPNLNRIMVIDIAMNVIDCKWYRGVPKLNGTFDWKYINDTDLLVVLKDHVAAYQQYQQQQTIASSNTYVPQP